LAERLLAKQPEAHGTAPAMQLLSAHLFQRLQSAPMAAGAILNNKQTLFNRSIINN
jgi:hypothetical protein